MYNKTKIAGLAAAIVLPATALTGGIAQAQSHHAPPPAQTGPAQGDSSGHGGPGSGGSKEQTGGKDTDNVQQGDQTGADGTDSQAATGEQSGNESGGPSDGPGGHADVGNVDHQFDGEE